MKITEFRDLLQSKQKGRYGKGGERVNIAQIAEILKDLDEILDGRLYRMIRLFPKVTPMGEVTVPSFILGRMKRGPAKRR